MRKVSRLRFKLWHTHRALWIDTRSYGRLREGLRLRVTGMLFTKLETEKEK